MAAIKRHMTLCQIKTDKGMGFEVTETRNTILYYIGQILDGRDIADLRNQAIEFTVKGDKSGIRGFAAKHADH
jgi:hypothetical protein